MIKFRCPKCNKKIGVPDEYKGKRVKCPKCKSAATVPKLVFEEMSLEKSDDIKEKVDQDNKSFEEDGLLDILLKDEPVESREAKLEPHLHPNIELTKDCPYCGEEILEIAQKCKHCKEHLLQNNQDNNLQQNNDFTEKYNAYGFVIGFFATNWLLDPIFNFIVGGDTTIHALGLMEITIDGIEMFMRSREMNKEVSEIHEACTCCGCFFEGLGSVLILAPIAALFIGGFIGAFIVGSVITKND